MVLKLIMRFKAFGSFDIECRQNGYVTGQKLMAMSYECKSALGIFTQRKSFFGFLRILSHSTSADWLGRNDTIWDPFDHHHYGVVSVSTSIQQDEFEIYSKFM